MKGHGTECDEMINPILEVLGASVPKVAAIQVDHHRGSLDLTKK